MMTAEVSRVIQSRPSSRSHDPIAASLTALFWPWIYSVDLQQSTAHGEVKFCAACADADLILASPEHSCEMPNRVCGISLNGVNVISYKRAYVQRLRAVAVHRGGRY